MAHSIEITQSKSILAAGAVKCTRVTQALLSLGIVRELNDEVTFIEVPEANSTAFVPHDCGAVGLMEECLDVLNDGGGDGGV